MKSGTPALRVGEHLLDKRQWILKHTKFVYRYEGELKPTSIVDFVYVWAKKLIEIFAYVCILILK